MGKKVALWEGTALGNFIDEKQGQRIYRPFFGYFLKKPKSALAKFLRNRTYMKLSSVLKLNGRYFFGHWLTLTLEWFF